VGLTEFIIPMKPTDEEIENYADEFTKGLEHHHAYLRPVAKHYLVIAARWAREKCNDLQEVYNGGFDDGFDHALRSDIKPLEWIEEMDSLRARPFDFIGKYTGPYYTLHQQLCGDKKWHWWWSGNKYGSLPMESEEEAKQAAQKHFEQLVKGLLK